MKLTFTQKEFDKLRTFQERMAKEFGDTAYVGADYATVLVEYSPRLKKELRPLPALTDYGHNNVVVDENYKPQFEYELLQLTCEDCKKFRMYLSLPGETKYLCEDCAYKRLLKAKEESQRQKKLEEKKRDKNACVVFAPTADDLQEGFTPQ